MKTNNLKSIWLVLVMLCTSIGASAYSFVVDGIYYNITSSTNKTCEVTCKDYNYNSYSGDVVIPSSVTYNSIEYKVNSIGYGAFSSCSGLTSVNIPNSVTSIGNSAFEVCSCLMSVNIPNSVTSIGSSAFIYCSKLTRVDIASIDSWCKIIFSNYYSNPLYYAHNLYLNGELVKELDIPTSVTSIGNYAFDGCSNLTSVNIPNSVASIGDNAFCGSAYKIYLNSKTPSAIGTSGFENIYFFVPDEAVDAYKSAWSGYADRIFPKSSFEYVANVTAADGRPALLDAIGGVGNENKMCGLKVNGTINGYDVMMLRNKLTNLLELDLSDATIVPEANNYQYYSGCYTQDNVLGSHFFDGNRNLRTVILPKNITGIGSYAFKNCGNLIEVNGIPESCTTIGNSAFSSCDELRRIKITKGVKSIGSYAFNYCRKLTEVLFEEGLETIGSDAFYNCNKLNNLRLPSSLKRIESSAFNGCSSLKEIHIPSMLEYIGDYAFESTGATDVYSYTLSPINISQNSFKYAGVTLHAPQEPESVFWDYYLNTQWSQFANVVPFDAKYSTWYTGENQDITLGEDETIPNDEEAEEPSGEMNPGSGIDYKPGSWQWLYELIMKWTGGKYPSLIDNSSVFVDNLTFKLQVSAGKWYFFCFPFDVELEKVKYPGRQKVWRYYDGKERAENSKGGWKNVTEDVLHAGQGYIFQTNKAGEIEITIKNPIFTGADKQVTISNHTSANVEDASWNFIGNPNLSYYDLGALANDYNCPITVWDPQNNTYNAVMPGDDDYQFHPFEAFFVQKPDGVNSVDFKAENRITSNGAEKVMEARRRARAAMRINENRLLINLAISNGEQTDKTRVVFNDEKSMDYETACDANKFLSAEAPQIYSLDSKNIKYSINERPKADKTVSLGIYAPAAGVYAICAQRMDCRMALKDNMTGTIHDLGKGDYEFQTEAGTFEARFTLMPTEEEATGTDIAKTVGTDATIYSTNGTAVGNSNGQVNAPAGVYVVKDGNKVCKVLVK